MKKFSLIAVVLLGACAATVDEPRTRIEAEEPDPIVATRWTDKTELFVEYPPLQVGVTSRFAIHLTDLKTFEPLTEGRATVELAYAGGQNETFTEDAPSRPGIFAANVTPTRAGSPAMTIRVTSDAVDDEHRLGPVEVEEEHHDGDPGHHETVKSADQPLGEEISFLKEQQWTLDFSTQIVESASMRDSLTVPAKVQPRSGGRVAVTAPISRRLSTSVKLPVIGTNIQSGQIVAAILPPTGTPSDVAGLDLAVEEARVKLDFARHELARLERLLEAGAIPARRVTETKSREALALAQLSAAQARLKQHEQTRQAEYRDDVHTAFQVRSPLSGVVAEVSATDGAHVEDGDSLIEVVAIDIVYVVGEIPEAEAPALRQPAGAEVVVPGMDDPIDLGHLVSVSNFVDPQRRTGKVIYELTNRNRQLAVAQAASLRLFRQSRKEGPAILESAVVDDNGGPVVYVQTGGESFERRTVTVGARQRGMVLVTTGLSPGERVVTKGAYLIRLSSMSTQAPAHRHVH